MAFDVVRDRRRTEHQHQVAAGEAGRAGFVEISTGRHWRKTKMAG
ncbi:MAG: hypothetical protein ABI699_10175 [Caldimonas sp.]